MFIKGLLLALIFSLSACGFHLKGEALLPQQLQQIQLSLSVDDGFNAVLTKQLKQAGAKIVDTGDASLLKISFEVLPEVIVANSSSSGLQIKRLKVSVDYSLRNADGKWLVEQQQLVQTREFEADTEQLLAKNREKQELYQEMKVNLARLLLYQLQLLN